MLTLYLLRFNRDSSVFCACKACYNAVDLFRGEQSGSGVYLWQNFADIDEKSKAFLFVHKRMRSGKNVMIVIQQKL